ncbi:MAG: aldo/keto reductase [Sciscionella sp.]
MSIIGCGCNQFGRKIDRPATADVVGAAIDAGINFFDTADRYGYGDQSFSGQGHSEEFLGAAIRARREEVVVATKFGNPMGDDPRDHGGGERWVRLAVEDSLRRLGTDRIDLYQLHGPDPETPIAETLGVLNDLVVQGKVREIGCSKFSPEQLREAESVGPSFPKRFASVQNEYSLLAREPEQGVLDVCREAGIGFLPYFPLAGGLLTGKYRNGGEVPPNSRLALFAPSRTHLGLSEENLNMVERYTKFAEARGHSILELAFTWLFAHQEVASVIAGATSPEQARQNAAAGDWHLTAEDLAELELLRQ